MGMSPTPAPAAAAPAAPAVVPPAVVPAPVAPATPAVAAPATPGTPAVAPATGPQEATASIPSPAEPGKIADAMLANEQDFVAHMAANDFKLSPEDIQAIETDVVGFIPTMLSRMYMKAQVNTLKQMERIVPAMIARQTKVMARNAENTGKFYSRWPSLNQTEHGNTVNRLAVTYRQMNPTASLEQMIEDLGPIVMMTAKVPMTAVPNGQGGPHAAAAPVGRPAAPPSPFRPAATAAASGAPQPGIVDPWAGMAGSQEDE